MLVTRNLLKVMNHGPTKKVLQIESYVYKDFLVFLWYVHDEKLYNASNLRIVDCIMSSQFVLFNILNFNNLLQTISVIIHHVWYLMKLNCIMQSQWFSQISILFIYSYIIVQEPFYVAICWHMHEYQVYIHLLECVHVSYNFISYIIG